MRAYGTRRTRILWPRQQVVKPTSASILRVPRTTAGGKRRSPWQASQGAAKLVAFAR